uniref:Uncharacterized protein n=1 Tax=Ixodes scapularis TaxID=6945 RepID=A0A4D5RVC8_IXOSC
MRLWCWLKLQHLCLKTLGSEGIWYRNASAELLCQISVLSRFHYVQAVGSISIWLLHIFLSSSKLCFNHVHF